MSSRRIGVFLLGLWLAGSFFMGWVAAHNLASVDIALTHPSNRHQRNLRDFGVDNARTLLRFHSAELSRHYFFQWERAQFVLGVLVAIVVAFATRGNKLLMGLAGAMVLLVTVLHFIVMPQMIEFGRGLDYATPEEMMDERKSFARLHGYYMSLDALKIAIGLFLAVRLMWRRRTGRKSAGNLDVIDDANHSHVDR